MNIKKLSVGLVILFLIIIGSIVFIRNLSEKENYKELENYKSVYQEVTGTP